MHDMEKQRSYSPLGDGLVAAKNMDGTQGSGPSQVRLVIVSGRSGSGKTSALNVLGDLGYYCIDNLPVSLLYDVSAKLIGNSGVSKLALGVDVRTPHSDLSAFDAMYQSLRHMQVEEAEVNIQLDVLYLTAHEGVLVSRFGATRRRHPLADRVNSLSGALQLERQLLSPIAHHASIKIDTSELNIHQLKQRICEHLGVDNQMTVTVMSFGFKYGIPIDADYVFDVRFLPNPHWHVELRSQTGKDEAVKVFFAQHEEVARMQADISGFLQTWLPAFAQNNRHTVLIGIGCTGGKHRSVFLTEAIGAALKAHLPESMRLSVVHREQGHW